ncbi:cysteine proteinase inhibitor [Striga asiatica]|uniref:Cysteine proteinase inhibitor n=1 Tax=Striga asiatica TaxID=4170 RepID=A0A5A7RDW6_STRAF|nr:cysteine proteinase inhibitor [Striga asiatica]
MALESRCFLFSLILLSLLCFVPNIACHSGDGWMALTPDEIKSKDMNALANYTVIEHNKEKKRNLVFEKLCNGYKHVNVSGQMYNLFETATDYDKCTTPMGSCDGDRRSYKAVVWVQDLKNRTTLLSFKKINVTCNLK